jgi:predicted AAA+ superfamily ATPase
MSSSEEITNYISQKIIEAPILARNFTIDEKGNKLRTRSPYVRIESHLDNFLWGTSQGIENRVIVMPGLRGIGKTTILFQSYNHLTTTHHRIKKPGAAETVLWTSIGTVPAENVLYFSAKDSVAVAPVYDIIETYVENVLNTSFVALDKQTFVLVDEAHHDRTWSEAAGRIFDKTKNIFILVTGSSALRFESNTVLGRRRKKEVIFPLSFLEYLKLKYNVYPPEGGIANDVRDAIFEPNQANLPEIARKWRQLQTNILNAKVSPEAAFRRFLSVGGYPISLHLDDESAFEKICDSVDKIITDDVPNLKAFSRETLIAVRKIVKFLAIKPLGPVSYEKLASATETPGKETSASKKPSTRTVGEILDVLEKTHLIIGVKPYGGARVLRKSSANYYFMHPCINAALRYRYGWYKPSDEQKAIFAENIVASYLYRMKETLTGLRKPEGLFYDHREGGVDFLITDANGEVVPIEVSIGKKGRRQIAGAIERFDARYGIVMAETETVSFREDEELKKPILRMPIELFSVA